MRNKESNIQYPELVGISFYTKNNSYPETVSDSLYWDKNESIYFNENKEENVFITLWENLRKEELNKNYDIEYISKNSIKSSVLDEFEILFFYLDDQPWREKGILSPYQNVNGSIELLDLENLSVYIANRKEDLKNLESYKDAYRKLVLEIDKYK